jgi:hypothetical protein
MDQPAELEHCRRWRRRVRVLGVDEYSVNLGPGGFSDRLSHSKSALARSAQEIKADKRRTALPIVDN